MDPPATTVKIEQEEKKNSSDAMDPPTTVTIEQEEKKNSSEYTTLIVIDQDHNEHVYMVRKGTPLKKLMDAYCVTQCVELNTFVFLFDGRRLRPEQTPEEAGLEDGDEIDTFQHQLGGCVDCFLHVMLRHVIY
ncbi:hypothetical protein Dsin_023145 [Dipteronia sinensis]|uniref:Ubiquitin-like domain-containing protein n=1 Tax=Dipteronia sinensis TaxID=43782 RepID=A0AAE0A3E3_9ROSI|nr:hypothetical protein Dsin_023145 [Dipteronia sinensis]